MDRQVIVLLLMMCGSCFSFPLDGQQVPNNTQSTAASQVLLSPSNESMVIEANITTGDASLREDFAIESNFTDGGVDGSINADTSKLDSTFDFQSNSTNVGYGDYHNVIKNNDTFVFLSNGNWHNNPFAGNESLDGIIGTNGTFGKESGAGFFFNIKNRFNSTSPDAIDRQNLGFGWFPNPSNGAFGQSYSNIGYPYGNGGYNGYDYSYPGGYRIPMGGNWPGYVPGYVPAGGYGGYPYDGYGYGVGPAGYIPQGYEFGDGYGYMNYYPNGYSSGYEYWKRMFGVSDPWYWPTSPRGYWNSVESWG